jgi:hypothetical protein
MRRTNQGGSLAGFIIIGVLLTLVLVGGLYGLNRYNAQRAADETAKTEEAAPEDKATDTKTTQTDTDSDTSVQTRTGQGSTDTQPSKSSAPAAQPAATSAQLPQTGPADTMLGLVAVTVLTFAGVHYARSRA